MAAGAGRAIARRTLADSRTRTLSFAALFAFAAATQMLAYASAYPTLADRLELARTFGSNRGLRLLYGTPHDLLHPGGWSAWRLGALPVLAGLWGVLGAVRATRAEEDAGRSELLLAGPLARAALFRAGLAGVAAGAAILWLATFGALALGGEDAGQTAYLALALVAPAAVFAGVGAVASQVAPTRRMARALGGGVLAVALLLRMVADTANGAAWLRWTTPLGWAEELRPFAGPRPLVLVPFVVSTVALVVVAARLAQRRDIGAGLLPARDSAPPRLALLSSPGALAVRSGVGGVAAWLVAFASFGLILGALANSVASGLSGEIERQLQKLGATASTAAGFLGLEFLFFVLAVSLYACFELAAVHEEEASGRLETLLVLPLGRRRWLLERLLVIVLGAALLALVAAVLAWAGAASSGGGVTLVRMLEAGVNCLPAALLFLGLGALAIAAVPRAGVALAYGLVAAAFLWETLGALLEAPGWALGLSPFHHVALVPAESFRVGDALVMAALGVLAGLLALWAFGRRDVMGG